MTTRIKAGGVALLIFAFSSVSFGATEYTASTLEELTNALNTVSTASGEAVLTIAEGTYDLSAMPNMHSSAKLSVAVSTTRRMVTIQGDPAVSRDNVVLDAGRAGRVMRLYAYGDTTAVVTLRNLTIKNGYTTDECGGVVTENWGRFNFENCVFEGNQAVRRSSAAGGTSDRYFTNCLFKRNVCGGTYGSGGVIDGPKGVTGCQFVENGAYEDQLKGVAVSASCTITNCIFDSNCNTGRWGCSSAVYLTGSGRVIDCTFTNNYFGSSVSEGGAVEIAGSGSVIDCRFFNNRAGVAGAAIRYNASVTNPGTISGCKFVGNSASGSSGHGGAIAQFPGLITNCTFIGNKAYYGGAVYSCTNIVDCVFAGNYSYGNTGTQNGGAGYMCTFYDSVITNNIGCYMSGAFSKCSAYGCKIAGSTVELKQNEHVVVANDSYFEDCELFGLSTFGTGYIDCGFNRCVIRDNPFNTGYGYFIGGKIAITNSLILRTTAYRLFNNYSEGFDNAIVNCTLVSNKYDILVHPASGATMRVVNNLFVGNKTRSWTSDDDIGQAFASSVYSNNYISTTQAYTGGGNINARSASAPKPRLMLDKDPLHPYAPDRKSALLGAGLVEDWMADSLDLAGNERLTDGKVAIGAYETTDRGPFPGVLLIIR